MFTVHDPSGLLVAYESWNAWRLERRRVADMEPAPLCPADTSFCAACWGQAEIYAPARNGEGLVPVACTTCDGTRVVANRRCC